MREYFSHDFNARNDKRLVYLLMKHGMAGIGLYWCIIEMLYESNGKIMRNECERIAYELRVDIMFLTSVIENFELFKFDKNSFWSESVLLRLSLRKEKSNKASISASKRWSNANALQTQSEGNAIKLNKSKLNKIKEKENINNTNISILNDEDFENIFAMNSGNLESLCLTLAMKREELDYLKNEFIGLKKLSKEYEGKSEREILGWFANYCRLNKGKKRQVMSDEEFLKQI